MFRIIFKIKLCCALLIVLNIPINAQLDSIENELIRADSIHLINPGQSIPVYSAILDIPDIEQELKPLVMLRLAYAQLGAGLMQDCRSTLQTLRALSYTHRYHHLAADEIEMRTQGVVDPGTEQTPFPSYSQIARSLDVGAGRTYATPNQAVAAARQLRASGGLGEGAIEIVLHDLKFHLDEPITLTSADAGTSQNPLLIRSASSNQKSIISGGRIVNNWTTETDSAILVRLPETSRGKVLRASFSDNNIPAIDSLLLGGFGSGRGIIAYPVPELFYKGDVQVMARWPNNEDTRINLKNFTDDRPLRWLDEEDLWLHGYWAYIWADSYEKVAQIIDSTRTIELLPPLHRYGIGYSYHWHAVNALSEIDEPGEWHISGGEGIIRYLPPENFNPDDVVLSSIKNLISGQRSDYIAILNVDLEYGRGSAITFDTSTNITVAGCDIRNFSGDGIKIFGGYNHRVIDCNIHSLGRGGLRIRTGDRATLSDGNSIVENCSITELSRIDRTYTPAIYVDSTHGVIRTCGLTIRNCLFTDIPSSGIRMDGNNLQVELCEFNNCVYESGDQGVIDTWGSPLYRGNIVRWNYIHDSERGAGVRLDDWISGFMVAENIFSRIKANAGFPFGALQIHGGKDNHYEGNLIESSKKSSSASPWTIGKWKQMLTNHIAGRNDLQKMPWESSAWMELYPALAWMMDTTMLNRNFYADNVSIASGELTTSTSSNLINNQNVTLTPLPTKIEEFDTLLVPWHPIPLTKIGLYVRDNTINIKEKNHKTPKLADLGVTVGKRGHRLKLHFSKNVIGKTVKWRVYDIHGRLMVSRAVRVKEKGNESICPTHVRLPSKLYLLKIQVNNTSGMFKIMQIR